MKIVVMGVTSTGKSLIGSRLSEALGGRFVDGDDLHPRSNVEKMARGEPLDDTDRAPWLDRIGAALAEDDGGAIVIACSALKRSYRDRIRAAAGPTTFVHLTGRRDLIAARMAEREGHFMPVSLLESQIATLEPPGADEAVVSLDIDRAPDHVVDRALADLERLR